MEKNRIAEVKRTEGFRKWYLQLLKEKKYYKLFDGVQFDLDMLVQYYELNETPIDTLNALSTVS